jgi:hypothetical protein
MIWLETPIINEFQRQIVLYKRYIDDIFLIWSGSPAEQCRFRERLGNANDNIKLEWQGTPSAEDAVNPLCARGISGRCSAGICDICSVPRPTAAAQQKGKGASLAQGSCLLSLARPCPCALLPLRALALALSCPCAPCKVQGRICLERSSSCCSASKWVQHKGFQQRGWLGRLSGQLWAFNKRAVPT